VSALTTVALRIVALAALAAAFAAAPSAAAKDKRDGRDAASPLDVKRVKVGQSAFRLSVRVETFGRWKASHLTARPELDPGNPQSYLCVELARKAARSRSCLGTSRKGKLRLNAMRLGANGEVKGERALAARVKRGGKRSFRASFRFREVGLRPGRFSWKVISGWGDPGCAPDPAPASPGSPAGPGNPPDQPVPPPAPECTDSAPDHGFAKAKLKRPRMVGCTHGGPLVRSRGSSKGKRVALTFDDGPSAYTSRVIKILDERSAKGTFFVVGQEIAGRQAVLRRALRHGHEVGNHTMHHAMLPSTSDMRATSAAIRRATGFRPCLFRPPGAAINLGVARGARSAGMTSVLWSIDTRDWTTPGVTAIRNAATSVGSGGIVLMHDGGGNRGQTIAALPSIVSELKRRGYRLVTVTRLLGEHPIWRP
jgi:peptidoglycan/xylan/chitin deacetylase (PgdA/CDA1 family)